MTKVRGNWSVPSVAPSNQTDRGDPISEILLWVIRVGIIAILFLPLVFGSKFFFPFIVLKNVLFRMITEVLAVVYAALAIRDARYRPKFHPLTVTVLAFFGIATLTSFTGIAPWFSLWGNFERMGGLLTLWHLALYFFILVNVFRRWNDYLILFGASVLVSMLMSLFAFGQLLEIPFLLKSSGGARLTATIGNATYLAAYLLFHLFLTGYLWYRCVALAARGAAAAGWRRWRWWGAAALLAILFALDFFIFYKTQTRGALIGLLVGMFVLAAAVAALRWRTAAGQVAAAAVFLCVLTPVALYVARDAAWVKKDPTLQRLTSISFQDVTSQSRLDTWRTSWKGWTEDPTRLVIGYGLENYSQVFNRHFPPSVFKDPGSQIWFDRAHNVIFDVGVTTGLLGLAAYLAIFGVAGWAMWRAFRQEGELASLVVPFSAIIAYFIQNLFVFDTVDSSLLFYLFVSAMVARTASAAGVKDAAAPIAPYTPNQVGALIAISGVAAFAFYGLNVRTLQANNAIYQVLLGFPQPKLTEQRKLFRQAIDGSSIGRIESRQQFANWALGLIRGDQVKPEEISPLVQEALDELKKSVAEGPTDVRNHLYYASVANRANVLIPETPRQAIAVLEPAVALSPTRPQLYFELGQSYLLTGDIARGLALYEQGLELSSHVLESHIDTAVVYVLARRPEEALTRLARAKTLLNRATIPADQWQRLIRAADRTNQADVVVKLYELLVADFPSTAEYYAKLAGAYAKAGDRVRAEAAARKALEFDPGAQADFDDFLKKLHETK